jgi:hypothetical protein
MACSGHCSPRQIESSTTRHGADDDERLGPGRHGFGQGRVRRHVGKVVLAGKEAHERSTLLSGGVAERPSQRRISGFECIDHGSLRDQPADVELHFPVHMCKCPQVRWEYDPDH